MTTERLTTTKAKYGHLYHQGNVYTTKQKARDYQTYLKRSGTTKSIIVKCEDKKGKTVYALYHRTERM